LSEWATNFLNTFVAVFVIIDPFAVVPIYLIMTDRLSHEARRSTRRKASLIAAIILATFTLSGLTIFRLFGITLPAFQIAGGILLLLLGIDQLNANRSRVKDEEKSESMAKDDISVFPLATPLIADPGAISTVALLSSQSKNIYQQLSLLLAMLLALAANHLILKGAPLLFRFLGQTGLNLITRLMGMILTAMAIQFLLNGLDGALAMMKHLQ